jgi:hypothetical protein
MPPCHGSQPAITHLPRPVPITALFPSASSSPAAPCPLFCSARRALNLAPARRLDLPGAAPLLVFLARASSPWPAAGRQVLADCETAVAAVLLLVTVAVGTATGPAHLPRHGTVFTPPRRRRLLSHVWDTMPCSQDRSGKAQPHNACSESQPRSAHELLPCHAAVPWQPASNNTSPAPGSHRRSLPQRVFFPSRALSSVLLCSPRPEPCSSSPAGSPWCRAPARLPRARLLPMADSRQAGPSRLRDGGCSGSPARHGCSGNRGRPCSSSSSRLQRLRDGGARSVFLSLTRQGSTPARGRLVRRGTQPASRATK